MQDLLSPQEIESLVSIRKKLHRNPELSGKEKETAAFIKSFLVKTNPDSILEGLGGHGLAAVYDSGSSGPSVLLRADIDALPIQEDNHFAHRSSEDGVAHLCGHDGHTTIMCGVALTMKKFRPSVGRLILLFQPEEETGQGAAKIIADDQFKKIRPDAVYALHNLPGYPLNTVVYSKGPFAAASRGMIIELEGKSSHAAQPEKGNSPVQMFSDLMEQLTQLPQADPGFKDFTLVTIIHARLGERAFGTNPGKAVVMATLRTFLNDDMTALTGLAEDLTKDLSDRYDIGVNIDYVETFPATINEDQAVEAIIEAARSADLPLKQISSPFKWSEDFGHFTSRFPGALFGIGSGENQPNLHNPDYDFPDSIIPKSVSMFFHIAHQTLKFK